MFEFDEKQLAKIEEFRAQGTNPYPSGARISNDLHQNLGYLHNCSVTELEDEPEVTFAARLRFKNELGSMGFGRVDFQGETLQICIRKNEVENPDDFRTWKKLDVGDWVLVRGTFMRTRTGELTVNVLGISLYSKCILGMPDKVVGLTDPESRHRMRYLDLIVNADSRRRFELRFSIIRFIRRYLEDYDFIEVETPILQPIPGGASARPFTTHHNSLDADLYMRVAPELYLKRLVVGGFERVFEIGKNFRNEGISPKHNPEFTMVEFYQAHATYRDLIKFTQNLITELVGELYGGFEITYGNSKIDFSSWGEARFDELLEKVGVGDPWSVESLRQFLAAFDDEVDFDRSVGDLQQEIFDRFVEPQLINPTFVTHYPASFSPLARRNDEDPRVTDRFELFINGFEVANGFSELNDPVDQAQRFEAQAQMKAGGNDEAMYFDSDYIRALSYGMPPTAGEGIGIDRLVMLLTNTQSIRDIILFPTKKVVIE